VVLGLVRPIRIDDVVYQGLADVDMGELPTVLKEGDFVRLMDVVERGPRTVRLGGQIWAKPWSHKATSTAAFRRTTKNFVFSHDLHGQLSEAEMLALAMSAGAVTPVTSYLAIEPGVRPSRAGFERGQARLGSRSVVRPGVRMQASVRTLDFAKIVAPIVDACRKQYPVSGGGNTPRSIRNGSSDTLKGAPTDHVIAHVTRREIVDVEPLPQTAYEACVVEGIWAFEMPDAYWPSRAAYPVPI